MAERLVLHIGTMKSGTSFLQSVLTSNPEAMAAQGLHFPLEKFGKQSRAVRLMFRSAVDSENRLPWHNVVESARSFEGDTAVVSMEFLSFSQPQKIAELLAPAQGLEIEVVLSVRDQFRAIPAQFQTYCRNFGTEGWESYLRTIQARSRKAAKSRAHRTFHRAQDVASILDNWCGAAGVNRVSVVTVPPSDAPKELLWQRFAEAAGFAPDGFRTEGLDSNESIGLASCDYLRRLNTHLRDVKPKRYREGVRPTVREVLAPLRSQEGRPEFDEPGQDYAAHLNATIHSAVARHQSRLVGDLRDLPTTPPTGPAPTRLIPPVGDVLRAAESVTDYCADGLGVPRPTPSVDVDQAVATSARLLRELRGWPSRSTR